MAVRPGVGAEMSDWVPAPNTGSPRFDELIGTTHVVREVPEEWKGRRVKATVSGGNIAILFGAPEDPGSFEVSYSAHSTSAVAWTSGATVGGKVLDGDTPDMAIDPTWTHFTVEASAADTLVNIVLSDFNPETAEL